MTVFSRGPRLSSSAFQSRGFSLEVISMTCRANNDSCDGTYSVHQHCDCCKASLYSYCPRCGAIVPDESGRVVPSYDKCRPPCGHEPSSSREGARYTASRSAVVVALLLATVLGCAPPGRVSPPSSPLHALVLQDVSTSIDDRLPRITSAEFAPLIDRAAVVGGTVAFGTFGVVCGPLVRVRFPGPAMASVGRENVFLRRPVAILEDEASSGADRLREDRARFLEAVEVLLVARARQTNLVAALLRAELFFAEAPVAAAPVLVLISDLQDTTGAASFELGLDPRVRLLAVLPNARDFGLLQAQAGRFAVFESVGAALEAAIKEPQP